MKHFFQKGNQINKGKTGEKNSFYGKKHTEESKKKMRDKLKGRKVWNKGKIGVMPTPYNKGKKCPDISARQRGKNNHMYGKMTGENNPKWKGGITTDNEKIRKSIELRLWREAVFARDNFTCKKNEIQGGELQAHHIQNFAQYPELRFAIDNGITLSEKAHREFHKIYGFKNNTKEQLLEFLIDQD